MSTSQKLCISIALLLLLSAVTLQVGLTRGQVKQPVLRTRLAEVAPTALPGWQVQDERLGATEVVNEAVLKTLNLDDYVYRRFSRDGLSFTVYAAYWAPGRMPTRLVASHTPDRCWTENGMQCVEMRFRQEYSVEKRRLLPAEYRAFTPPGGHGRVYVVYWHTVQGKIYDYGARFNAVPHPLLWWKDTFAQAAYGSREQLFVRVASETPLDELWNKPDFQRVMGKVAEAGLWDTTQPPGI